MINKSDTPRVIDISPEISNQSAVFPGDTPFKQEPLIHYSSESRYTLSRLTLSPHTGAHADSPRHYSPDGIGSSLTDLTPYLGACQVIRLNLPKNARIKPEDLTHIQINARRVLFATESFPDPNRWNPDFNSLSPELVDYMADRGVILIGIDTPSVDPASDPLLHSHHRILDRGISILEGISLHSVGEGKYFLIALPLKIKDSDASPVRAILLSSLEELK